MSTHRRSARGRSALAAAAAGALALGGLTAVAAPAQAAPAFATLEAGFNMNLDYDNGTCARKSLVTSPPTAVTLPDTGSATRAVTGTQELAPNAGDPTTMTERVAQKMTVQSKAQGSQPVSIRLHSTLSSTTTAASGNTCTSRAQLAAQVMLEFTATRPLWLTVDFSKRGKVLTAVQLMKDSNDGVVYQVDADKTSAGRTTILLPAGHYVGALQIGYQGADTTSSAARAGEADVSLAFAPMGAASAKPSGKALGYTSLGSARSCSTHSLTVGVTKSASKLKKIAKVSWSVNGKTVKTLKGKSLKRGTKAKLKISDTRNASVKTVVKLKNGKTRTATASYRPCA